MDAHDLRVVSKEIETLSRNMEEEILRTNGRCVKVETKIAGASCRKYRVIFYTKERSRMFGMNNVVWHVFEMEYDIARGTWEKVGMDSGRSFVDNNLRPIAGRCDERILNENKTF